MNRDNDITSNLKINPKISVIVPCYNQATYLDETLATVLNQTHNEWECIIINDGSTDFTKDVALKWTKKDSRFNYIEKTNGGLSSARNAGIKSARGDYVQFLDADDLIKPFKFEKQLNNISTSDISVCDYFSFVDGTAEKAKYRYLSPFLDEKTYKKEIIVDWEYRKSIPCHCIIFKKKLIDDFNLLFNEDLPNHEDWEFWVKLFYHSNSLSNTNEVFALYRIRHVSMSVDHKLMRKGFLLAANSLKRYFKSQADTTFLRYTNQKIQEIKSKNKVPLKSKLKSQLNFLKPIYRKYVKKH